MPVLIMAVTEDLDKLFEDCGMTAVTSLGEMSGVVIVTVDVAFVLIIGVLSSEHGRADRAGEVFDVILAI
jgi:hypothetical protein